MIILILVIIFGLIFSYFATQNTGITTLNFGPYSLQDIPIYLVVLGSMGISLLTAGIIYLIRSLSSSLTIGEKETELKNVKRELAEITKEVHKLEIENTKLKTKLGEEDFDDESI